ncbi:MAG: HAD-IA family hydrolase [Alphaproteobacteria bacterium]
MSFKVPKAIVFDWDNTLVDSWPNIMDAINQTRTKFGLSTWSLPEIMENCTRAARDSFPEWFGAQWEEAYAFYYSAFDEVRSKREIKIRKGSDTLLHWLKEQSIPAFIVSNKRGDYLRHEVERLKWNDFFVAVIGAQDAPRDKPAREHVDHALSHHPSMEANAEVWFVGDSITDVECARNANCTPVFIGTAEEAKKHGVELFFSDCQGLQTLLYNALQQK